jgi:hypothetical protein
VLARCARNGTTVWHREPRRTAAAMVWIALAGTMAVGYRGHALSPTDVWQWYGVGDCRVLARKICASAGFAVTKRLDAAAPYTYGLPVVLGDRALLHSSFRQWLLHEGAQWEQTLADDDRRRDAMRPLRVLDETRVMLRARQVAPMWSVKCIGDNGRATVMLALGSSTDDDDYELVGMSIPDAHELARVLREALDGPIHDPAQFGGTQKAS